GEVRSERRAEVPRATILVLHPAPYRRPVAGHPSRRTLGRLFRRDDLVDLDALERLERTGLPAAGETRSAPAERGAAAADRRGAAEQAARRAGRIGDRTVLVDEQQRQIEDAPPGDPIGRGFLRLVGHRQ